MTKKPKPTKTPPPQYVVQNCSFTNAPQNSDTINSIARALEANAKALNALANQLTMHGPMLSLGNSGETA